MESTLSSAQVDPGDNGLVTVGSPAETSCKLLRPGASPREACNHGLSMAAGKGGGGVPSTAHDSGDSTALSIAVICFLLLCGLCLRHAMEKRDVRGLTETGACMMLGVLANGGFWAISRLSSQGAESWRAAPSRHWS